jgi:hypothetical protein
MQLPALQQRLNTYQQWKTRLARAIQDLETWLEEHRRATPRAREQLRAAVDRLQRDRLTIALVAESSRGKTELINAMFFPDFGGRLLPSSAGRSTLCPTELRWDEERNEAYLRLLPVETRAKDTPISALKADPEHWVQYRLNVQDPERMAAMLGEILQTKTVSPAEASRLGFAGTGVTSDDQAAAAGVVIPKWRHAILSLPHPLLQQGLVILDTPGVSALDSSPDLAMGTPLAAEAVLFVLAADTGVAPGDLEFWQRRLTAPQSGRPRALLVALNKVDVLWEASRDGTSSQPRVAAQRRNTAEALGIPEDMVFPVSAQKGLVAKIRLDEALLRRSGLPALERHLGTKMLETKHQHLKAALDSHLGQVLERNRNRVAARMARIKSQLDELEHLRDQSQEVVAQLMEKTRREQERYLKVVQQFQHSREELLTNTRSCRQSLEREAIEAMMERADRNLAGSWTSLGLARAMRGLFDELRRVIQAVATESEQTRKLVRETYQIFREDYDFDLTTPKVFTPMKYGVEINLLFGEVETYSRSPRMAFLGQGRVIRRFDQQMVSRARVLFDQLRTAYDGWIRDSLQPLAEEIQGHKTMVERQLDNLQRVGRSNEAAQRRIDDLQTQYVGLARELTVLRNIHNAIQADPMTEHEAPERSRLVAG